MNLSGAMFEKHSIRQLNESSEKRVASFKMVTKFSKSCFEHHQNVQATTIICGSKKP